MHADHAVLQAADGSQLPGSESDLLLLDYLAAAASGSNASSSSGCSSSVLASARRFVCCRMLHDAVHAAGTDIEPKAVKLLLVQHRKLQDSHLPILGDLPCWPPGASAASAACAVLQLQQLTPACCLGT